MYDRILVPTDGSPGMVPVVEHARSLALAHDGSIHALYVIDTGRFSTFPVESSVGGVTAMLQEEGEFALEQVEDIVDGAVPLEQTMIEGEPSTEIIETASDADCDVIVMGTHGRGGLDRLLLGSVAERTIRRSDIPVVTVPVGETDQS